MNWSYLLLGGNMGDRLETLKSASGLISERVGKIILASSYYETAAWGKVDQPSFLNQAILVETSMEAVPLLEMILNIEQEMGRFRKEKYGPRVIDIDILFFNEEIIQTMRLVIPHPEIQNRRFVLDPISEIAPEFVHPLLKKSMKQLKKECKDPLSVKKLENL